MTSRQEPGTPGERSEVIEVSQGRKPGAVVSVRLSASDYELLVRVSETAGASLSETLRLGLHCLVEKTPIAVPSTRPMESTRAGVYRSITWNESPEWALTNVS